MQAEIVIKLMTIKKLKEETKAKATKYFVTSSINSSKMHLEINTGFDSRNCYC